MARLTYRVAGLSDLTVVLSLMREFYAEDHLVFEPERAGRALRDLFAHPEWGEVLLLGDDAVAEGKGFLVLLRGFTLEHGGAYLLLDELYLEPTLRGRGLGREALELAHERARTLGVSGLRLEVNHHNTAAKALYARAGFRDESRDLMFRPVG